MRFGCVALMAQVVVWLMGCVPQLAAPDVEFPARYIYGEADVVRQDSLDADLDWWSIYNDPILDSLEAVALEQNRDVAVAALRVESARYALAAARAEFMPSLEAEL